MHKALRPIPLAFAFVILCSTCFSQSIKGTYAIKNVATGMLLRIKDANNANGTPLVAYDPVNWKCMTWDFHHVEGQVYQLQNLFTGKTFEAKSKASEGVSLEQQPLEINAALQEYEFVPVGKNIYLIKLKDTGLYLTLSDSNGSTNSAIILAKKSNDKLQQWTIYEQHPAM
jgi:hypothetical protein